MVTSGKSVRSCVSTSPMLMSDREGTALIGARSLLRGGARVEDQAVLADLDLVAPGECRVVDALTVDVGPVEGAYVAHMETAVTPDELRVPAGHRDVVEEDVRRRVPAGGRGVRVEQEPAAAVGSAADDEQGGARRQGVDRGLVGRRQRLGPLLVALAGLEPGVDRDGRRLAGRGRGGRGGRGLERGPAAAAEPCVVGVAVTALGAERHRGCLPRHEGGWWTPATGVAAGTGTDGRVLLARLRRQVRTDRANRRPPPQVEAVVVQEPMSRPDPGQPARRVRGIECAGQVSRPAWYAAASRSVSAAPLSSGRMVSIQPSPYGSELTSSGEASSASLRSTTVPESGA